MKIRKWRNNMSKKTDKELMSYCETGDYSELSLDELERLKKLIELKNVMPKSKQETIDTSDVDIPDIAKQSGSPTDDVGNLYADWCNKDRGITFNILNIDLSTLDNTEIGGYFNYDSTDAGCEESSQLANNWQPSLFAKDIIQAAIVKEPLFRICRAGYDWGAGKGDKVYIRQISAAPSLEEGVSACTCLSCASNTFDKYTITIQAIGSYHVECSWDAWKIGGSYRRAVVESMQRKFSNYFGAEIFSELNSASWGNTETLNNTLDCDGEIEGSCCTNGGDLMARILDAQATLLEAGYNPDYVIMSPSIANYLLYKESPSHPLWFEKMISTDGGYVSKIGALNVVVTGHATACSSATATAFAWVIDSSRALGYAFGKRPSLEIERSAKCNSYDLVMWTYFGCTELDVNAGVKIVSPNS